MPDPLTHSLPSSDPGDRLYSMVYRALLFGMTVSTLLFALGILLVFVLPVPSPAHAVPVTAAFSWRLLRSGNPLPIFAVATAILILTPIARVAVSVAAFLLDRDYKFAFIAGLVLAIVLLTLLFQLR